SSSSSSSSSSSPPRPCSRLRPACGGRGGRARRPRPAARAMPRGESRIWTRSVELDAERGLSVSLVEDPTLDLDGEAWCSWCLWPAARALVGYLATLADAELAGLSVLELGSGCGAVGIYLQKRGAGPVVLTDVHRALPLLKRNVGANRASCEVCALLWGTPPETGGDARCCCT
ncbi:unnamed protein product, partial [Prorocentrum cordatum]